MTRDETAKKICKTLCPACDGKCDECTLVSGMPFDIYGIADWIQEDFVEKHKYDEAVKVGGEMVADLSDLRKGVEDMLEEFETCPCDEGEDMSQKVYVSWCEKFRALLGEERCPLPKELTSGEKVKVCTRDKCGMWNDEKSNCKIKSGEMTPQAEKP